jgi:glycosyltransferase involved in cell wall biosynthesis
MATLSDNHSLNASGAVAVAPSGSPPAPVEAALPSQADVATIRVLHVINGEYYAGAERVQDLLAARLPEFGYQPGFACVKLDLFDEMRQSRNTPLTNVPMWSRFDLRAAWKIADLVRREQYRIIHGHTVRTALVAALAARLTGVAMVYHAHSPAACDTTHHWRNRFNSVVERISLRRAAKIIAVSKAIAEHLAREGVDPSQVTVVHNGVPSPKSLPERLPPDGEWTLGAAALFRPRKGIETLLEAMALLRNQNVPVRLRAVGAFESPEYEAEIAGHIRRLGLRNVVTWRGFQRDVTSELLKMDLFVLPSLFGEGLPMVVLEAMAAGVPVIASDVPGVSEAVRHGEEGLLVPPGDVTQLAESITAMVDGRFAWSTLRANALRRHADAFSDHTMAAGVAAVYRRVLQGAG